jgi:mono/diheme cytochrome c family protein
MPRRVRLLATVLFGLVVLVAIGITATVGWRPFLGPRARAVTDRRFEPTAERLARGAYLVEHVTGCIACHSPRDLTAPGFPTVPGSALGGRVWSDDGLPWLVASNNSADRETGVGAWTDDMLARAIREGVGQDGRALFPIMPYRRYRLMSDEDLASVIVYLRSLPPVRQALPKTRVPFPPGRLINSLPEPLTAPVPTPEQSTPARRGEYLVGLAACGDCHTPMKRGEPIAGLELGGGFLLQSPAGPVASANITPDPTGIPYYDETVFVNMMRTGRVVARKLSDVMPWYYYRAMTDEDLRAVFAYLKTLRPARHAVDNTLPPTACKLCGERHGAGERN